MVQIAINPAAMAASLSEIMNNLPLILDTMQTLTYILLVLLFGSIAIMGFRMYAPLWKKLLLRFGFGFLSLFAGSALSGFMPLPDNVIVKLMQLDMMVGGVVASIVFAVALFVLSRALSSEETLKKAIEKLQNALKKEQAKPRKENVYSNPYFLAGIVIIILFLIFSAFNFSGFPRFQDSLMEAFGMTQDEFDSLGDMLDDVQGMDIPEGVINENMTDAISDMPRECTGILMLIARYQLEVTNMIQDDYENPSLKADMEERLNEMIFMMKRGEIEGTTIVMGIADTGSVCVATEEEVCLCSNSMNS